MDEQREWLKKMRKRRLRILAVVLCFSVLAMSFPSILKTLSVDAALPDAARGRAALPGVAQAELTVPEVLEETTAGETGEGAPDGTITISGNDENTGGETPGGGNTGGENPGGNGNTGGENPGGSGSTGGENPGGSGDTSGENPGGSGNTGGENPGGSGDTGGENPGGSGDTSGDNPSDSGSTGGENPGDSGSTGGENPGDGDNTGDADKQTYIVAFYDGDTKLRDLEIKSGNTTAKPEDPTKDGFIFNGWVTEKGGSIPFDFSKPIEKSVSVYASWKEASETDKPGPKVEFKVTFYDNDKEFEVQKVESGNKAKAPAKTPTNPGYKFKEWTVGSENGPAYDFNAKVTENLSLYASWERDNTKATITYDVPDDEFGETPPKEHVIGTVTTLPEPRRMGYTFVAWYTNENLEGTAWTQISAQDKENEFSFYAKWTAKEYTVTLDYQDGVTANTTQVVTYDDTYGSLPLLTKVGSYIEGWYTRQGGAGSKITAQTSVQIAEDHTLYAYWERYDTTTQFSISYDLNGGIASNRTVYTSFMTDFSLQEPKRPGYTFVGWTGTDVPDISKDVIVKQGSVGNREYTAYWTPNSYTVKFNYNGATGGKTMSKINVLYDSAYGMLPFPEKKNCLFGGWYTDSECREGNVTESTPVMTAKSHTLYAKWSNLEGTYTVTLKNDTGYTLKKQSDSVSPVYENDNFTFKLELKSGYEKSDGFAVMVNDKKVNLTSKDTYTIQQINENKVVTVKGVVEKGAEGEESGETGENQTGDGNGSSGSNNYVAPRVKQPAAKQPVNVTDEAKSAGAEAKAERTEQNNSTKGTSSAKSKRTSGSYAANDKAAIESLRDRFSMLGSAGIRPDAESNAESNEGSESSEGNESNEGSEGNKGNESYDSSEDGARAGNEVVQSLSAAVDNGRIVLPGEPVPAGNVAGMLGSVAGAEGAGTTLDLGDGSVTVKVVCQETDCKAGVADAAAVANAVLTPEQIAHADAGGNIEVRVDVKDISGAVTEQDHSAVARCIDTFQEELPGLAVGMYTDISIFMKNESGAWNNVPVTTENIDVVIGIPESLLDENRAYYMIRVHDGSYTLLSDMDGAADTITVSTDRFSSYAIVYRELGGVAGSGSTCELCHICPTFLGNCCFLWLGFAAAVCCIVALLIYRKVQSGIKPRRNQGRMGYR